MVLFHEGDIRYKWARHQPPMDERLHDVRSLLQEPLGKQRGSVRIGRELFLGEGLVMGEVVKFSNLSVSVGRQLGAELKEEME